MKFNQSRRSLFSRNAAKAQRRQHAKAQSKTVVFQRVRVSSKRRSVVSLDSPEERLANLANSLY